MFKESYYICKIGKLETYKIVLHYGKIWGIDKLDLYNTVDIYCLKNGS
mgnify:CR=1 FL=1